MQEKFGLEFRVVDSALVRQLRRDRGLAANVFTHYPRLIVSLDWLKLPNAQKLLNDVLPAQAGYPRRFDLLVVDEVHQCAPAGGGKYATDSLRTIAIRRLAGALRAPTVPVRHTAQRLQRVVYRLFNFERGGVSG
jgi:hypothetical protein